MLGKWFLLKALAAIVIVVIVGVVMEFTFRDLRLRSGLHAYFVVSSQSGYVATGRGGGHAWQRDSIVAGPFRTAAVCEVQLRSAWTSGYPTSYYCEDLLLSDARGMKPEIINSSNHP